MEIDTKAHKVYLHFKIHNQTKINIKLFATELELTINEVVLALERLEEEYGLIKIKRHNLAGDYFIEYTGKALREEQQD